MAATRLVSGSLREVWQESVPQDGGTTQVIQTGIAASSLTLSRVSAYLIITGLINSPVLDPVLGLANGKLTVSVANLAPAGNAATWTLDITFTHSAQQGGTGLPAPIHIVQGVLATGLPPLAETFTVAKFGGDFVSVAAAVAHIVSLGDAGPTKPYGIQVAPGSYIEPPFTIPSYVSIFGIGLVVLIAANNAAHFITGSFGALLNYVTIFGPTGFGQAAIRYNGISNAPFLVQNVLLAQGYYGILVDPAGPGSIFCTTVLYSGGGAGFNQFIRITGSGSAIIDSVAYSGAMGAAVQGLVVTGPAANASISNSLFSLPGGTDAIFVDDSAVCRMLSCQLTVGTNALHVGPNGNSTLSSRAGFILKGAFTKDILVDSANATVFYSGSASRVKLDIAIGATFSGEIADVTTGSEGETLIGALYVGSRADKTLPLTEYARDSYLTGRTNGGEVTRAAGRVLNVASGYGYINDDVQPLKRTWLAGTVTIAANSTEYVWVDSSGNLQHTVLQPDYADAIILAQAISDATDIIFLTKDDIEIAHLASRLQEFFEDNIGPISVGGAGTSNAGALQINVDNGTFSVGLSERDVTQQLPATFVYWYQTGPGTWLSLPGSTVIDTTQYNDPVLGLQALPGTKYKKDCSFIAVSDDGTEVHVVYGQEIFDTQIAAEQGSFPIAPEPIQHYAMRSGGIVVLSGAIVIASVVDARPRLGQSVTLSGAITDHGGLTGLSDDDHLQYLNVARANVWHFSTPIVGEAHVLGGNTHAHGPGGDGGQVDHTTLANRGIATHAQIDFHIADTANPHATTASQVGAPPTTRNLTAGAGLTGGGDLSADRTFAVGANADGSITVNADDIQVGVLATDVQHGARGGGTQHAVATTAVAGFLAAVDKTKLDTLAANFGANYQATSAIARTTLTGAGSTSYPPAGGATKVTMTTPALPAGTYKVTWSAVIDYSVTNRDLSIRIQNTTDTVTLWESIFRPSNAVERQSVAGEALIVFAGVAKTIAMQFHTANVGDTAGVAFAYLDIVRVS